MGINQTQVLNIIAEHVCVGDGVRGYAREKDRSVVFPFGVWPYMADLEGQARRCTVQELPNTVQRFLSSISLKIELNPPLSDGEDIKFSPSAIDALVDYLRTLPRSLGL